nr:hotdog fold thioesterase [Candidatus Sigynarchaeota archaeon]
MDPLQIVKKQFENDNFARKFGIILDAVGQDFVKMHMTLEPGYNNLFDRPHGGAIYALADAAFSVIGNNNNNLSVALECSISYHASPDPGQILYVEGREVVGTRKIGTYLFTLYTVEGGEKKTVATMKSTLYKTGKPIQE